MSGRFALLVALTVTCLRPRPGHGGAEQGEGHRRPLPSVAQRRRAVGQGGRPAAQPGRVSASSPRCRPGVGAGLEAALQGERLRRRLGEEPRRAPAGAGAAGRRPGRRLLPEDARCGGNRAGHRLRRAASRSAPGALPLRSPGRRLPPPLRPGFGGRAEAVLHRLAHLHPAQGSR